MGDYRIYNPYCNIFSSKTQIVNNEYKELLELNAGFISATQVAAEMGRDLEDIYRDREREKELAKQYGLDFTINNMDQAVENIKPKLKSVSAEKYNRENTSFTNGNILEGILNNE